MPDAAEFAEAWLLVFAVGSDEVCAKAVGDEPFEVFAGEAFVAQDDLPGADEVMVLFQQGLGDLASPTFGFGRPQMTGIPSGVLIRYRRKPQK